MKAPRSTLLTVIVATYLAAQTLVFGATNVASVENEHLPNGLTTDDVNQLLERRYQITTSTNLTAILSASRQLFAEIIRHYTGPTNISPQDQRVQEVIRELRPTYISAIDKWLVINLGLAQSLIIFPDDTNHYSWSSVDVVADDNFYYEKQLIPGLWISEDNW